MKPKFRLKTILCLTSLLAVPLALWAQSERAEKLRTKRMQIFPVIDRIPNNSGGETTVISSGGLLLTRDQLLTATLPLLKEPIQCIGYLDIENPTTLARTVNRILEMAPHQAKLAIEEYTNHHSPLRAQSNYEILLPFLVKQHFPLNSEFDGSDFFHMHEGLLFRVAQPVKPGAPSNRTLLDAIVFDIADLEFVDHSIVPTDDPYSATLEVIAQLNRKDGTPSDSRIHWTETMIWYQLSQAIGHLIDETKPIGPGFFDAAKFKARAKDLKVKWHQESQQYIKAP